MTGEWSCMDECLQHRESVLLVLGLSLGIQSPNQAGYVVVKEAWEVWEGWTGRGSLDSLRKQSKQFTPQCWSSTEFIVNYLNNLLWNYQQ